VVTAEQTTLRRPWGSRIRARHRHQPRDTPTDPAQTQSSPPRSGMSRGRGPCQGAYDERDTVQIADATETRSLEADKNAC